MKIEGEVKNILFFNEENGYTVFSLSSSEGVVTVTGMVPKLFVGEEVEVEGYFVEHKKYGQQFIIEFCNKVLPTSEKGIVRYLSSGLIKGIGPVLASKMVKKFGKDIFKIIEENSNRLFEIEKLGQKKIDMILQSFQENKNIQSILIYLHSYNIGHNLSMRIYNCYRENTYDILQNNPYDLIHNVGGVGFKMADEISLKLGIAPDSDLRITEAIKYIFNTLINSYGHTILHKNIILKNLKKIVDVEDQKFEDNLNEMVINNQVKAIEVKNEYYYTLNIIYTLEKSIYLKIKDIADQESNIQYEFNQIENLVNTQFPTVSIDQKEGILSFLNSNFVVITGGPGTGKTTLIKIFVMIAKMYNKSILLCAPTGRAAKRLSEATWSSSKTIHRMLEWNPNLKKFNYNKLNTLKQDIIIIDESSMIDIYLMNHLLNAINIGTKVVFVGDADQLPSVGPGNLLYDFISLFSSNVVKLKKIFRQALNSKIILNAHKVNKKMSFNYNTNDEDDFIFCKDEDYDDQYLNLILHRFPNIQILSPMQKGSYGVKSLNEVLQNKLNSNRGQKTIIIGNREFRVDDKVIQLINNYDVKVFNGDIGVITNIDENKVYINFDDILVEYEYSNLDQITLAYAITIHKSQGSEYDYAMIFLMREQYIMLNKNLIYTAITRAKKKVIIIGNSEIITASIKSKESKRLSILSLFEEGDISSMLQS